MRELAKELSVEPRKLLSHVLDYRIFVENGKIVKSQDNQRMKYRNGIERLVSYEKNDWKDNYICMGENVINGSCNRVVVI